MPQVIREYRLAGDGIQAPGAIVLAYTGRGVQQYVTWFRNDQDTERTGKPCYYSGHYFSTLEGAEGDFLVRCPIYDPTGDLWRDYKGRNRIDNPIDYNVQRNSRNLDY